MVPPAPQTQKAQHPYSAYYHTSKNHATTPITPITPRGQMQVILIC